MPDSIAGPAPPARTLSTATAFFLRADGAALTAAHAVAGCRRLLLAPPGLAPMPAEVRWRDDKPDLALLRVSGLRVPNALALAPLPAGPAARGEAGRLAVLGFAPGGDGPPGRAAAAAMNGWMPPGMPADPSRVLWLRAPGVGHGWSGGPVIDLATGRVAGMVSFIAPDAEPDLTVAVGAGTMLAALREAGDPNLANGAATLGKAEAALARLFCWR